MDEPIVLAKRAGMDAGRAQVGLGVGAVVLVFASSALVANGVGTWLMLPIALAILLVVGLGLSRMDSGIGKPAIAVYADRLADLRKQPPVVVPFAAVERWHFQVLTDLGAGTQERTLRIESPAATTLIGRGIEDYRQLQDTLAQLLPADKLAGAPPPRNPWVRA